MSACLILILRQLRKCSDNLSDKGLTITLCNSPAEEIHGADIITTCTADKKNATILTSDMVPAGVHINAIGGDCLPLIPAPLRKRRL